VVKGRPARAACLYGAAEALRETRALPTEPADHARYGHYLTTARAHLGAAAPAAAWAAGRALTVEQAVAFALEEDPGADPPIAH